MRSSNYLPDPENEKNTKPCSRDSLDLSFSNSTAFVETKSKEKDTRNALKFSELKRYLKESNAHSSRQPQQTNSPSVKVGNPAE